MGVTVRIENAALHKFNARMKDIIKADGVGGVRIGIFEDATNTVTGEHIASYAACNEFGHDNTPPRPFMRMTLDKNIGKWASIFTKSLQGQVGDNPAAIRRAFTMLGRMGQADMQAMIRSNMPPPNKPETRARKEARGGYAGTLVDTGEMLKSVEYQLFNTDGSLSE